MGERGVEELVGGHDDVEVAGIDRSRGVVDMGLLGRRLEVPAAQGDTLSAWTQYAQALLVSNEFL